MPRQKKLDDHGIYQRKDSSIYYYSVTVRKGVTKCFSSGKSTLEEAIKVRDAHVRRVREGTESLDPSKITVKGLVDKYLSKLEREGKDPNGIVRQRLCAPGRVIDKLGNVRASKLSTQMTIDYRNERRVMLTYKGTPVKDTTINRELMHLRAAYYYGFRGVTPRLINEIPKFEILRNAEDDGIREVAFPPEMYEAMRDSLPSYLQLLFVCAYHTGMRMGELLQLEWDMVDFDDLMFNLPGRITKNGRPRHVPLSRIWGAEMLDRLATAKVERDTKSVNHHGNNLWEKYIFMNPRTGRPVKNFRTAWDKYTTKLGIAHINFHDLRRTAIKNLERAGVPQRERMLISGHLTPSMEARYNFQDKAEVRQARERMEANILAKREAAPVVIRPENVMVSEEDLALLERLKKMNPTMRTAVETLVGGV